MDRSPRLLPWQSCPPHFFFRFVIRGYDVVSSERLAGGVLLLHAMQRALNAHSALGRTDQLWALGAHKDTLMCVAGTHIRQHCKSTWEGANAQARHHQCIRAQSDLPVIVGLLCSVVSRQRESLRQPKPAKHTGGSGQCVMRESGSVSRQKACRPRADATCCVKFMSYIHAGSGLCTPSSRQGRVYAFARVMAQQRAPSAQSGTP